MLSGDRLMVDFKRMGVSVSVCEVSAGSSSVVGQVLSVKPSSRDQQIV